MVVVAGENIYLKNLKDHSTRTDGVGIQLGITQPLGEMAHINPASNIFINNFYVQQKYAAVYFYSANNANVSSINLVQGTALKFHRASIIKASSVTVGRGNLFHIGGVSDNSENQQIEIVSATLGQYPSSSKASTIKNSVDVLLSNITMPTSVFNNLLIQASTISNVTVTLSPSVNVGPLP